MALIRGSPRHRTRRIRLPFFCIWGPNPRFGRLVLRYYQAQTVPVYAVTSDDLQDERWSLRAWHADRWLLRARLSFRGRRHDASRGRTCGRPRTPAHWSPAKLKTGNANLSAFFRDGFLERGRPPRYADFVHLNDRLRERARAAFLAFHRDQNRVELPFARVSLPRRRGT